MEIGPSFRTPGRSWPRNELELDNVHVLISPSPQVRLNKNDAADVEAICEAVSRPSMRFVPIKSVEQKAILSANHVFSSRSFTSNADHLYIRD